jgi:alpha-mannosidase
MGRTALLVLPAPVRCAADVVVVTSLRRRLENDRLELRVFNPYDEAMEETLTFGRRFESATLVDLEGQEQEPLSMTADGKVKLHVPAKRIATVAVRFKGTERGR